MMKEPFFKLFALEFIIFVLIACQSNDEPNKHGIIYTVNGVIEAEDLKFALIHEHIMSNFGKDISDASQYDETALLNQVIPYLKMLKSLGVTTVFDCTTAHFGRRVDLLKIISDSTGIQIITNTGFYGAANDRYVPDFAYNATAGEISKVWIDEFENGIDGTGIKPGFVKLAFDEGVPSDIDIKLFEAGILTHLATGLTLTVHTANNPEAANAQIQLLQQYNVSPEAWVWVHAHLIEEVDLLIEAASKGGWISLDGASIANIEKFIKYLEKFRSENLLHKILLSHDGDGFPAEGDFRPFDAIPKSLIPALQERGFTDEEINLLMIKNPKEAFMVHIRKTSIDEKF